MDFFISILERLNLWAWWAIAGVILIAEMLTGTSYLLWPAAAAFLTGFFAIEYLNLPWHIEMGIFAVLSIILLWAGDRWVRPMLRQETGSGLNDRSTRMIGQRVVTVADFQSGRGRVSFGDTEWAAETADGSDPGADETWTVLDVKGVILVISKG